MAWKLKGKVVGVALLAKKGNRLVTQYHASQRKGHPRFWGGFLVTCADQWKPPLWRDIGISSLLQMILAATLTLAFASPRTRPWLSSRPGRPELKKRLVRVSKSFIQMVEVNTPQVPSIPFWLKMALKGKSPTHIHLRRTGFQNGQTIPSITLHIP